MKHHDPKLSLKRRYGKRATSRDDSTHGDNTHWKIFLLLVFVIGLISIGIHLSSVERYTTTANPKPLMHTHVSTLSETETVTITHSHVEPTINHSTDSVELSNK